MKKHDFEKRLSDLIYENLSPDEEKEIYKELVKHGMTEEEIRLLISSDHILDEIPVPGTSDEMDKRFYTMLEDEGKKILLGSPDRLERRGGVRMFKWPLLRVASGIALFVMGFLTAIWLGRGTQNSTDQMAQLSGEVKQLKVTLVMSMIRQNSPVERIKAVNMISNLDDPGSQVINSLINVLDHDGNDNVRLLALDALIKYSGSPQVRDGLVSSLSLQTSPLIQMRLTEILVALREKKAVPEFKKMLDNENLNYSVRGKINNAVVVLL